ncbi:MAG: hypothetical protein EBY17_31650, partial [Acidobacteriia bacterium]|nr:hypothetical protein [Terriglobia bacterium]
KKKLTKLGKRGVQPSRHRIVSNKGSVKSGSKSSKMVTKTFYHRTSRLAADAILAEGFKSSLSSIVGFELFGVWLSDRPLSSNEGTKTNEVLLEVTLELVAPDFDFYELVEKEKPYREWCIPAEKVNSGRVMEVTDEWSLGFND